MTSARIRVLLWALETIAISLPNGTNNSNLTKVGKRTNIKILSYRQLLIIIGNQVNLGCMEMVSIQVRENEGFTFDI